MVGHGGRTVSVSIFDFKIGRDSFRMDSTQSHDLSIPLRFGGDRLSAFGIGPAESSVVSFPGFCGDTTRGGSCNVEEYRLIPHGQGTHTECVGHVVDQDVAISDVLKDAWIPATVFSLSPEPVFQCRDQYAAASQRDDTCISCDRLCEALDQFNDTRFHCALIIRTLPNPSNKKTKNYDMAPFFSSDAMAKLAESPVRHLLVDIPSVDRMDDQGMLSNHRLFWGLAPEGHDLNAQRPSHRTITELIYVPDSVTDGYYLLNLQIPAFIADTAPSRPLIYPLTAQ